MAEEYRNLSQSDRGRWDHLAAEDKKRYLREMENYTPPDDSSDSSAPKKKTTKKKMRKKIRTISLDDEDSNDNTTNFTAASTASSTHPLPPLPLPVEATTVVAIRPEETVEDSLGAMSTEEDEVEVPPTAAMEEDKEDEVDDVNFDSTTNFEVEEDSPCDKVVGGNRWTDTPIESIESTNEYGKEMEDSLLQSPLDNDLNESALFLNDLFETEISPAVANKATHALSGREGDEVVNSNKSRTAETSPVSPPNQVVVTDGDGKKESTQVVSIHEEDEVANSNRKVVEKNVSAKVNSVEQLRRDISKECNQALVGVMERKGVELVDTLEQQYLNEASVLTEGIEHLKNDNDSIKNDIEMFRTTTIPALLRSQQPTDLIDDTITKLEETLEANRAEVSQKRQQLLTVNRKYRMRWEDEKKKCKVNIFQCDGRIGTPMKVRKHYNKSSLGKRDEKENENVR